MSRRDFLKKTALVLGGVMVPVTALEILKPERLQALRADEAMRWGFLVDTYKCVGCGFCVKACKLENGVPYDADVTRTWVERYVLTKDGAFHADSPWARATASPLPSSTSTRAVISPSNPSRSTRRSSSPSSATSAPIRPACRSARSAPPTRPLTASSWSTGPGASAAATASWPARTAPGSSIRRITRRRSARSAITASRDGLSPACVQACPFGARQLGNLKDPDDPVTRAIATEHVAVLKSEYGTKPQVFYVGLDWEVR